MFLKSLTLENFRNYERASIQFSDRLNVFVGQNAQGKTNLIEAVLLSSIGKSFRASKDRDMIRFGADRARIKCVVENSAGGDKVDVHLNTFKKKAILINDVNILKVGELMGIIPSVIFTPKELKIVQSSPAERRAFLDIALSQMSRAYFYALLRYEKVLCQRNRLLKSGKAEERSLSVWDAQLAFEGAKIIGQRRGYVERLKKFAYDAHLFLSDGKEELALEYVSFEGNTVQEITDSFEKTLLEDRERDMRLGYTNSGPHKDDIKLTIRNCSESEKTEFDLNSKLTKDFEGGIDIRAFGSQGQQRTAALALKIAELELFSLHKNERPILLLDDVLSELDKTRAKKLLEKVSAFQTLLTTTHLDFDIDGKAFEVKKGTVL